MSATVEQGGTTATYLEAQTILTLAMTEGVGDQVRALRAYAATVYTDLSCRLTTARAATLELLAEKDAVLRAWKANTREILLALGIDAPDGPTLAEAREHMESWLSVETELHAISDVATGARPAEDFIPAEGVLGEVIRALAEKDAGYVARGTTIASLEGDVTAMLRWQQEAVDLLRGIEAWIPHQGEIADRNRKRLLKLIGKLPPDDHRATSLKSKESEAGR